MASPLFRTHSDILAGSKTGSRKVVGLKMAAEIRQEKNKTSAVSSDLSILKPSFI
jgi:hypothetical protein